MNRLIPSASRSGASLACSSLHTHHPSHTPPRIMADSHYFHAPTHRFVTPQSRTIVLTRFVEAVRDVLAKCWYNVKDDASPFSDISKPDS